MMTVRERYLQEIEELNELRNQIDEAAEQAAAVAENLATVDSDAEYDVEHLSRKLYQLKHEVTGVIKELRTKAG
jgi:hypothetical protein